MPTTLLQIQREQQRADTIAQVQAALTDSTKVLSADVLAQLVAFATGRNAGDGGLIREPADRELQVHAQAAANHMVALQQLNAQLAEHAHAIEVLTNRLNDIRTFLRLGTAEELAAAVAGGQSKSLTDAEIAAAKAKAIERAKERQTEH
jgi:hypothetical protein